jgi:Arc/MetJ-type ribon-helix-helix transcriptional regulator
MKTITLNIDEETRDELDEETDERGYSSRSEYLREIIDSRHEADEVRQELDQAEARAEDLRRQLQERGEVEETTEELVERTNRHEDVLTEFAEAEQQDRHNDALAEFVEQEREKRQAGVVERTKWWLFGRDAGAVEEDA